jgi:GNAT superfamily N-acetyltransferase
LNSWTAQRVLAEAAAMEWCPDGAIEVRSDEYRLIRYPDWVVNPTFPAAHVTWSRTTRPLDEVIPEVTALVRGWALAGVAWWVSPATEPSDTEEVLRAKGAIVTDEAQVLARELTPYEPPAELPANLTIELVRDECTFRAASDVTVKGWERPEPDPAELARQLEETLDDLERWSDFRVVAFVDGEPASTGGCTLAGQVAQLWGAVTLPAFRHRGAYRAILAERLRLARQHGADLALVKGRATTSAPILLRSGFTDYGQDRCCWLPIQAGVQDDAGSECVAGLVREPGQVAHVGGGADGGGLDLDADQRRRRSPGVPVGQFCTSFSTLWL